MNETMPPNEKSIENKLMASLSPVFLEVMDESAAHAGHAHGGGKDRGTHFRVRIASPRFDGLSRVARHRLVYDALQDFLDQGLHALAIETL